MRILSLAPCASRTRVCVLLQPRCPLRLQPGVEPEIDNCCVLGWWTSSIFTRLPSRMEVDNVITQAVPSVYPVDHTMAATVSSLQERWCVSSASGHARRPVSKAHVTLVSAWGRWGFTRQPESPNVHISGFRPSKHHQNSTRRPPERHRNNETVAGKGRKRAEFGAPHPSGPHPSGSLLGGAQRGGA